MKKILIAAAGAAALSMSPMTFADSVGDAELAKTQALIKELQADKRTIMLETLALTPDQKAAFLPIYDEYQADMKVLYTEGTNLRNRLFVSDYGGITDTESKSLQKEFFKLRHDRLDLLEKYSRKLDNKLPETKVLQFVQVENKVQALLDVAAAATIPIATTERGSAQ
jgi:hypothetical protein